MTVAVAIVGGGRQDRMRVIAEQVVPEFMGGSAYAC